MASVVGAPTSETGWEADWQLSGLARPLVRWMADLSVIDGAFEPAEARRRYYDRVNAIGNPCLSHSGLGMKSDMEFGIGFAWGKDTVDLGLTRMKDVAVQRHWAIPISDDSAPDLRV